MNKEVSIVIPFYRNVAWLQEALESIFAQTYDNYEVILVNDGSLEDVSSVLKKYEGKIIYVYQANSGPGAARNAGIRIASGEFIAFQDSDDIWLPTKLEKQVAFMKETGAMWSHTGFYYWWPESGKLKVVNTSRDYGDIYLQRLVSTKIATPSVMLNRKIYDEEDFFYPEDIRNGEDDRLYTKLARHYKIALIQEPLLKVRMRGTNSQNHAIERFKLRSQNYDNLKVQEEHLPLMIHIIYAFYNLYSKLFRCPSNGFTEFLAKCCWTIPYFLERVYVIYLFNRKVREEEYIQRS